MLLTVTEASKKFDISGARIRKLINEGRLSAEKHGRQWFVEEESLICHQLRSSPGRPTAKKVAVSAERQPRRYMLMSRGHEVARCVYDPVLKRFTQINVLDPERVPLRLRSYKAEVLGVLKEFNGWWGSRTIPDSRYFLRQRLFELGLSSSFEIPLRSLGLSLSDQYWLRPEGSDVSWDQINYFRHSFEMGEVDDEGFPLSSENMWMNSIGLNTPDNTTDGMLQKRWILDECGRRVLIKGNGTSGREVYNEVIATMLYRRLLPNTRYVEYRLASWRDTDVSACETFLRDDEEFIPAWQVVHLRKKLNHHSWYQHYCELCDELNVSDAHLQIDRMIVCDSILANVDRHWGNFGIIRNVETLQYRAAPIFDTGCCLWSHVSMRNLATGNYQFTTKPFHRDPKRQLDMIIDASWYHPEALDGFVEEVHEYLCEVQVREIADLICEGLAKRIEVVNAWARNAVTSKLSPEDIGDPETLHWIWL